MKTNGNREVIARVAWKSLVLVALLAPVLLTASISHAQTNGAKAPPHQEATAALSPVQAKEVAAQPGEPGAKGVDTGIKVHGHWVINVFSPDGQLVSHTEFENALQSTGMVGLAQVLARGSSVGTWELSFAGTSGPCNTLYPATGGTCIIKEGGAIVTSVTDSTNCPCEANMPGPKLVPPLINTEMQLVGALTFPSAGNVTQVETIVDYCGGNISPQTCRANPSPTTYEIFTSAKLPTAVSVAANQLVQITVTFSFS